MSLLPPNKIPTTWVKGTVAQSSSSGYVYKNHCYQKCGDAAEVPPCMVSYFVNNGTNQPYSVLEQVIDIHPNAGTDKITYTSTCPNYKLCPVIGGISPQVQLDSSNFQCNTMLGKNVALACLYPLATFQDEKNVAQYVSTFGENSDYNNVILPYFCSSQVKHTTSQKCPLDPFTNLPMTFCSQIVSNDRCKNWIRDQIAEGASSSQVNNANNILNNYCATYNTPDCDCLNRQQNPVYQVMATGSIYPDTCWWTPCKDTTQNIYLVPTEGLEACNVDNTVYCPSINLVIGGNSQGLSFNPSSYTDCSGTIDNGGGGGGGGGGDDGSSIWSNYWWAILLVVAIIITIVVLIIILL